MIGINFIDVNRSIEIEFAAPLCSNCVMHIKLRHGLCMMNDEKSVVNKWCRVDKSSEIHLVTVHYICFSFSIYLSNIEYSMLYKTEHEVGPWEMCDKKKLFKSILFSYSHGKCMWRRHTMGKYCFYSNSIFPSIFVSLVSSFDQKKHSIICIIQFNSIERNCRCNGFVQLKFASSLWTAFEFHCVCVRVFLMLTSIFTTSNRFDSVMTSNHIHSFLCIQISKVSFF